MRHNPVIGSRTNYTSASQSGYRNEERLHQGVVKFLMLNKYLTVDVYL